ncbi:MAG: type II toxin-antitoxin system RelE/ParE family toxin [Gammaproteobacteria bacterium]|nr:type II toxin-antitoxin system RelE/ParE family toxin [Gammaproteobacteria bacterium]
MIESFGNRLAEDLFYDRQSKATRAFPKELVRAARRKILVLHDAAELADLRAPPGNRLESLRGKWRGYFSIRINDQWRIVFKWNSGRAGEVAVVDYH